MRHRIPLQNAARVFGRHRENGLASKHPSLIFTKPISEWPAAIHAILLFA
jgi:hypothetical protein